MPEAYTQYCHRRVSAGSDGKCHSYVGFGETVWNITF